MHSQPLPPPPVPRQPPLRTRARRHGPQSALRTVFDANSRPEARSKSELRAHAFGRCSERPHSLDVAPVVSTAPRGTTENRPPRRTPGSVCLCCISVGPALLRTMESAAKRQDQRPERGDAGRVGRGWSGVGRAAAPLSMAEPGFETRSRPDWGPARLAPDAKGWLRRRSHGACGVCPLASGFCEAGSSPLVGPPPC